MNIYVNPVSEHPRDILIYQVLMSNREEFELDDVIPCNQGCEIVRNGKNAFALVSDIEWSGRGYQELIDLLEARITNALKTLGEKT